MSPLQIDKTRNRITGFYFSKEFRTLTVTMPLLHEPDQSASGLLEMLSSGRSFPVSWSEPVPPPDGEVPGCGKWYPPQSRMGKLVCLDIRCAAGERVDIEAMFRLGSRVSRAEYEDYSVRPARVVTWSDFLVIESRDKGNYVTECRLRLTRENGRIVTTGTVVVDLDERDINDFPDMKFGILETGATVWLPRGPLNDLEQGVIELSKLQPGSHPTIEDYGGFLGESEP